MVEPKPNVDETGQPPTKKSGIFSNKANTNNNAVALLHRFVYNPDNTKALRRRLKSNKIVTIPTIRTDGFQLHVTFIDLTKPTAFQVDYLASLDRPKKKEIDNAPVDNMNYLPVDNSEAGASVENTDGAPVDIDTADGADVGIDMTDGAHVGDTNNELINNISARSQLHLTEISSFLTKHPAVSGSINTVMGVDEGVLYPIDVSVITMQAGMPVDKGTKKRMRVRKKCLYRHENEHAAKLELLKETYRNPDDPEWTVLHAEADLGATGTKNSFSWSTFRNGYFAAWRRHQERLFSFYHKRKIRAYRFTLSVGRQSLYDKLTDQLLKMLDVKQHQWKPRGCAGHDAIDQHNRSKLVVLGQQAISTKHHGHRASKHAIFWRYFARKAAALHVRVVGLTEHNSSKVCMRCCQHIEHDAKKRHRVFWCERCEQHFHRDDSSAEIHAAVAWSEIAGHRLAAASPFPVVDPTRTDADNDDQIVYYRSMLFRNSIMKPNNTQDPRAKGSAFHSNTQ
jgi:hypothetical protein